MSDLHLTDEQLETLRESHAGLHGLVVLWRDADDGPWHSNLPEDGRIYNECCSDSGPVELLTPAPTAPFEKENAEAICLTRNTIELAIAETYWMNQFGIVSSWLSEISPQHSDRDWYLQQHVTAQEKLAAIRTALEEK